VVEGLLDREVARVDGAQQIGESLVLHHRLIDAEILAQAAAEGSLRLPAEFGGFCRPPCRGERRKRFVRLLQQFRGERAQHRLFGSAGVGSLQVQLGCLRIPLGLGITLRRDQNEFECRRLGFLQKGQELRQCIVVSLGLVGQ